MNTNATKIFFRSILFTALSCMFLAACGRQPNASIQVAQPSTESFVNAGDYEMHFNAVRSDQLTADVAREYGIDRSKNKVLLNVSVLNHANGSTTPIDAKVTVIARNLSNQMKDMPLRRISERNAIYYIGEVDIGGAAETLVFEINAVPSGSNNTISAKLTREFFAS